MNSISVDVMENLISIYDAVDSIFNMSQELIRWILQPGSAVSETLKIADIIGQFSPFYDPDAEWEDSPFARVLTDQELSARQRAIILLMGTAD